MVAPAALFATLVDDAGMFPPGNAPVADAVPSHLAARSGWFAPLIGPLVVRDTVLAEVGRAYRAGGGEAELEVSVVNTGGAGGITALAGRVVDGVRVIAVESALRDLDDLRGNAARVASAAAELDDVAVYVEFPDAPGWERAVEEVEAAGLLGKIRAGGPERSDTPPAERVAHWLSVLIEADLPFKATAGLHHAWSSLAGARGQHGFLNLMLAVDALVEGAAEAEAADLLASTDHDALLARVAAWSDADAARIRRRLRSFGCCGVEDPVRDLVDIGLVQGPT